MIVAAAVVLSTGCGLEVVAFLSAPIVTNTADVFPEYGFSHNPESNPEFFLGFEVYYKFYTPNPDQYVTQYEADLDVITSQFTSSPATILVQRGFRRVNNPATDDPGNLQLPLLPVPLISRGISFAVQLSFPGDLVTPAPGRASYLSFTGEDAVILYRSARATAQEFQSFSPEEVDGVDEDVPNSVDAITGVALGIVVMAYGRDRSSFPASVLYSAPVGLGVALLN